MHPIHIIIQLRNRKSPWLDFRPLRKPLWLRMGPPSDSVDWFINGRIRWFVVDIANWMIIIDQQT